MIKNNLRRIVRCFGYEIRRAGGRNPASIADRICEPSAAPPPVDPIWPLPHRNEKLSRQQIRERLESFQEWHYGFELEGGIRLSPRHRGDDTRTVTQERPLQRFRHFMPWVVASQGGSLAGKRVLDIGCNSGFWSIQCALMGAEVVAFDARCELIEQLRLLQSVLALDNIRSEARDFWDMTPESLGGPFDVVLNLGILYHLPAPLEVLRLTKRMAKDVILLDTGVCPSSEPIIRLHWEEPEDIRSAKQSGVVAYPSKSGIDLMLGHVGAREWHEIPIRTRDMPQDYLEGSRASWLIRI